MKNEIQNVKVTSKQNKWRFAKREAEKNENRKILNLLLKWKPSEKWTTWKNTLWSEIFMCELLECVKKMKPGRCEDSRNVKMLDTFQKNTNNKKNEK